MHALVRARPGNSFRSKWARIGLVATLAIGAVTFDVGSDAPDSVQAIGGTLGAGGEYHPLTPVRIFDSRDSALDVEPFGRKATVTTDTDAGFDVQIAGRGGLPAFVDVNGDGADDNVLAVAVNITVINPSQLGFLQAYGKGSPRVATSVVNFTKNSFVPNMAILRPGAEGKLTIHLVTPPGAGLADIAIDLFGWFSATSYVGGDNGGRGARLVPAGPGRIFDSREDAFGSTPIGSDSSVKVQIRGADASNPTVTDLVPANDTVTGVLVNITGVNALPLSAPTFVAVLPTAPEEGVAPTTSNLNLLKGQVRSVMGMVPVGPDGAIYLYNLAGEVDLIVDVVGYLLDGADVTTRAGRVVPLVQPRRAFDSRLEEFGARPLPPAWAEPIDFASFVDAVSIGTTPVGAQLGVLGNLTATDLKRQYTDGVVASFLTAYPPAALPPTVSNITIKEGETQPNLALLRYGADSDPATPECNRPTCVMFYNLAGYLHYIFDASAVILDDE